MFYEYSLDTGFRRNDGQLHPIVIPEKAGTQTSCPEFLRSYLEPFNL